MFLSPLVLLWFRQGSGLWGWVKWEWRKCLQTYRANFISAYFISPHVVLLSGPEITMHVAMVNLDKVNPWLK